MSDSVDPDLPSAAEVDGDPLASINHRVGARLIDLIIVMMVSATVGLLAVSGATETDPPRWAALVSLGFLLVYESVPVAWRGQTLGKMVLGIQIVRLADGRIPSLLTAALRVFPVLVYLALVPPLVPQFWLVGLVFVYFSGAFMQHNRGVLDLLAGTVVIQARRR